MKEQNPGADLLVAVDWKKLLKDQAIGAQDLPKVSDIIGTTPETVTIEPRSSAGEKSFKECRRVMNWIKEHRAMFVSVVVLLVISAGFGLARMLRKRAQ